MASIKTRCAHPNDIEAIKQLADANRDALGFVVRASLEEQIRRGELIVAERHGVLVGFVCFHHRRDGWTTIRELCVAEGYRRQGVGRALVQEVEKDASRAHPDGAFHGIRLKCPLELPSNGFYSRLGFVRVAIEEGKRRPLVVWEKPSRTLLQHTEDAFAFFLTLTGSRGEIHQMMRLWHESGDPRNPFARVICTPLFSRRSTLDLVRRLKDEHGSIVMFDSGGFQVQMGRLTYEELFERLQYFYCENSWADWYVLPDHVPRSTDSDQEVEIKVRETIDFARLFVRQMPSEFAAKAVGVVHGRTEEQVRRCVEAYAEMGIRYIGFGSFGTSGPKGSINLVSQRSLELLRLVQRLARKHGLRLHIFGIGSPSYLIRLAKAHIIPTSFDSAGWWKAGGFGNVFFPGGKQLHITAVQSTETTLSGLERQKKWSGHECPFCSVPKLLRLQRMRRILHNLSVMLDTIEQLQGRR